MDFDFAGFVIFIHSSLSIENEKIVDNAIGHLEKWIAMQAFIAQISPFGAEGTPGILDSLAKINKDIHTGQQEPLGGKQNQDDLCVLLTILASCLSPGKSVKSALDILVKDYPLITSFNHPRHNRAAMRLILRHKFLFFKFDVAENWDHLNDDDHTIKIKEAMPHVRIFWTFCVLVARELFRGEHRLTPIEALVLGLVDEIPGNTLFESRRQFEVKRLQRLSSQD